MGDKEDNVLVAVDGADIDRFDIRISQSEARNKLGLPQNKKIVLHKGHLYDYVGAADLAAAMSSVTGKSALAVFIGGTEEDVQKFKDRFGREENILILGHRPRPETPVYQKAADILVISNSAKFERTKSFASPLKLFGYMASGVPIIASDLPALREVVNDSLVTFCEPDNPESIARMIDLVLDNYDEAKAKATVAFEMSENYTWKKRVQRILDFIRDNARMTDQ
jgi:glycosyltransferase involved in cell wall biosynthesis